MTITSHQEITVGIRPWFADHYFASKVVLPAVETMAIQAAAVKASKPETQVRSMKNGRFDKFLAIDPQLQSFSAFVALTIFANGDIDVTLSTRTRLAAMTRVKEHGRLTFTGGTIPPEPSFSTWTEPLQEPTFTVTAASIYQDLVPFGPAYRNITGSLQLSAAGGQAMIRTPELTGARETTDYLGSPFALDAAFHAACVWGQRYQGIVAFPVGFAGRVIWQATRPGEQYSVWFRAKGIEADLLLFDLEIRDAAGTLYESVTGLTMRDVSGGRIKPPAWIRDHCLSRSGPTMASIFSMETLASQRKNIRG